MSSSAGDSSRSSDIIEIFFLFLLRNWKLVLLIPLLLGGFAYIFSASSPTIYTASVNINAPESPVSAFDTLLETVKARIPTVGSETTISISGVERGKSAEEIEALLSASKKSADDEIANLSKRRELVTSLIDRLSPESSLPDEMLSVRATAIGELSKALDVLNLRADKIAKWRRTLSTLKVKISSRPPYVLPVLFAAVFGFILAIAIAALRSFWTRTRSHPAE